jgi:hypothetical protein
LWIVGHGFIPPDCLATGTAFNGARADRAVVSTSRQTANSYERDRNFPFRATSIPLGEVAELLFALFLCEDIRGPTIRALASYGVPFFRAFAFRAEFLSFCS